MTIAERRQLVEPLDISPRPKRRTRGYVMAAALAVGGLFAAAAWFGQETPAPDTAASASAATGAVVTLRSDGTVLVARPGVEHPLVEVYEDYQCPYCRQFEQGNGKVARQAALDGKVALLIHPVTIFQDDPMRGNSRRALLASLCVTDPGKWLDYHDALYDAQPDETEPGGFPEPDLVALAGKLGIPPARFTSCMGAEATARKAESLYLTAAQQGVQGTPTVRYEGKDIDWSAGWGAPADQPADGPTV